MQWSLKSIGCQNELGSFYFLCLKMPSVWFQTGAFDKYFQKQNKETSSLQKLEPLWPKTVPCMCVCVGVCVCVGGGRGLHFLHREYFLDPVSLPPK